VKDRTSCEKTLYLGCEDDIVKMVQLKGAMFKMLRGPTCAKGRPNRATHFLSLKKMQPQSRGGEPFTRQVVHKLERKEKREIIREEDRSTRRKQPQVEDDVEALPRHFRRRMKTLSVASP
jgi:hypothetical protein